MRKFLIIDTSILCVYLKLPTFTSCGKGDNTWNFDRIAQKLDQEIEADTTLVLPLATIIETGNHISQSEGDRFALAKSLSDIIVKCADSENPWSAFSEQSELWSNEPLKELAEKWPELAARKISIGDATIADVAEYYSAGGTAVVEIISGDSGLVQFTPIPKQPIGLREPRRRKK